MEKSQLERGLENFLAGGIPLPIRTLYEGANSLLAKGQNPFHWYGYPLGAEQRTLPVVQIGGEKESDGSLLAFYFRRIDLLCSSSN